MCCVSSYLRRRTCQRLSARCGVLVLANEGAGRYTRPCQVSQPARVLTAVLERAFRLGSSRSSPARSDATAEHLREQIAKLTNELALAEDELTELAITRKTLTS